MITILTPSYNRGKDLNILYKSLLDQTSNNFEWLIVDDGSTDDTAEIVQNFIDDNNVLIRYIKKVNGGKHTALNVGINNTSSLMTFIVDSDDILTSDAVATIDSFIEKYKGVDGICGFSFLRKFPDGKINGKKFEQDEIIGNLISTRINGNDESSDKAEVYYTDCLKEFPFPEVAGEKFLGEDVVWMRMARKYNMVFVNKAIYVGNYLEGGLTKNRRTHNIKSPNGCVLRANEYLHGDVNFKIREKSALQYLIYGWFAKRRTMSLIKGANQKLLVVLNLLPAKLLYIKWKKEFEENN